MQRGATYARIKITPRTPRNLLRNGFGIPLALGKSHVQSERDGSIFRDQRKTHRAHARAGIHVGFSSDSIRRNRAAYTSENSQINTRIDQQRSIASTVDVPIRRKRHPETRTCSIVPTAPIKGDSILRDFSMKFSDFCTTPTMRGVFEDWIVVKSISSSAVEFQSVT